MATSDSDNFESADEEIEFRDVLPQKSSPEWVANSTISSDSDDDVCVTSVKQNSWSSKINNKNYDNLTDADDTSNVYNTQHNKTGQESKQRTASIESSSVSNPSLPKSLTDDNQQKGSISNQQQIVTDVETDIVDNIVEKLNKTEINKCDTVMKDASLDKVNNVVSQVYELDNTDKKVSKNSDKRENTQIQEKSKESSKSRSSGVKKLGSRIGSYNTKRVTKEVDFSNVESKKFEKDRKIFSNQDCFELDDDGATKILERESSNHFPENSWHKSTGKSSIDELDEVPPELKSNKKFKEVFGAGDWQDLGDQDEIINEFDTENLKPVLDKLTTTITNEEKTNVASGGWGSWGSWGVTTLLNTASVGVSNLTSQVSYGLSVLEESINAPSTTDHEQKQTLNEKSVGKKFFIFIIGINFTIRKII